MYSNQYLKANKKTPNLSKQQQSKQKPAQNPSSNFLPLYQLQSHKVLL